MLRGLASNGKSRFSISHMVRPLLRICEFSCASDFTLSLGAPRKTDDSIEILWENSMISLLNSVIHYLI